VRPETGKAEIWSVSSHNEAIFGLSSTRRRTVGRISIAGGRAFNPLTPTVAMGTVIKHHVLCWVKPSFVIFDIRALGRSGLSVRVPGCQKRLNPVWHKMLYSCARMATVAVRGLTLHQLKVTVDTRSTYWYMPLCSACQETILSCHSSRLTECWETTLTN